MEAPAVAYVFLPHYLEIIASLEESLVSQQHRHWWMLFSGSPSLIAPQYTLRSAPQKSFYRPWQELSPLSIDTKQNFRRLITAVIHRDTPPSTPSSIFYTSVPRSYKRKHFPLCIISHTCQMSAFTSCWRASTSGGTPITKTHRKLAGNWLIARFVSYLSPADPLWQSFYVTEVGPAVMRWQAKDSC